MILDLEAFHDDDWVLAIDGPSKNGVHYKEK